ncbi:hypothetical protein ACTFIR_004914 [Dictyostelium discoideum]
MKFFIILFSFVFLPIFINICWSHHYVGFLSDQIANSIFDYDYPLPIAPNQYRNFVWNGNILFAKKQQNGDWPNGHGFDGNGVYFVFGRVGGVGPYLLMLIGKGSRGNNRGLYERGRSAGVGRPRYFGYDRCDTPILRNAEIIMYYKTFEDPPAVHVEIAPRLDVLDYILNQRPSVQDFLNLNNYPSAPQILREEPIKRQNLTDCYNQLDGLRAQNQLLIDHNQHLLTYQGQLIDHNAFLIDSIIFAMTQIPDVNDFLRRYGPGLSVSSEGTHNWDEFKKNGGIGGIGGISGIDGIGGVDDGKKGDGKNGADGADDGWLKSGCICPETPPCPVVIPCPEPVVCNIAKIQIQLNSTIKSLDECKKQKDQANGDLNVCQSHKDETQGWLTDCQKEYVKQTSHSSKDDTLTSLRNCQSEYRKETFKKDKLCRGLSKHVIGILDFCEEKVEKLRLANCE